MRDSNLIILFMFIVLVFSIVTLSGNLHAGPRLVDDNQIFKLDRDIRALGFFEASREHFSDRTFRMGRLVPVYLTHKLLCVKLLGTEILHWSIYSALLGALTTFLLYLTGRQMGLTTLESIGFGLITVLGEQSILWWRLMHGEGLGLLFVSAGLLCMTKGVHTPRCRFLFDALFVLFMILASLSKESFIILFPAVCYWQIWIVQRDCKISFIESLRGTIFPTVSLAIVSITEIYYIYFILRKSHFGYTGWKGYESNLFIEISREFFLHNRAWIVAISLAAALAVLVRSVLFRSVKDRAVHSLIRDLSCMMLLAILIIVPQLLLYMSSGFSGRLTVGMSRYLVPATIGLAVLGIVPMQLIREHLKRTPFLSRSKYKGYRILVPILMCAVLVLYLLQQVSVAYEESLSFARYTEERGRFLNSIHLNTKEDDTIVIAYNVMNALETRRLSILLQEYIHRKNIYYVPVNRVGRVETGRYGWPEKDFYSEMIDARSLPDVSGLSRIDAVLMVQGDVIELPFLLENRDWFDPLNYKRFQTELKDTVYIAADLNTVIPDSFYSLPALIELIRLQLDQEGAVFLRGYGLSPEYIKTVQVSIDGNPLGPVSYPERMVAAHRAYPDYFNEYSGFSVKTPFVGSYIGKPIRVKLIGDTGIIVEREFEANYAISKDIDREKRAAIFAPLLHSLETRIERSKPGIELDGHFTFRGWALSPHPIDEVIVMIGDIRLQGVQFPLLRKDIYKFYPEYLTPRSGFKVEVPKRPDYLDKNIRVLMVSNGKVLAEEEFPGFRVQSLKN